MYSVTEYAQIAGITRQAVLKRIKEGKIKSFQKVGNTYIITEEPFKKNRHENN